MPGPALPIPRRRALLLAAGSIVIAAAAGACGTGSATDSPAAEPPASGGPTPDAVRRDVASAERALMAEYDAAMAAFPELSTDLAAIRAQHADHLAAMADDGAEPAQPAVPASPTAAIGALRAAEQQAARERRTSCVATPDGDLARVLALIAASEQSHAVYLRELDTA